MKKLVLLALLFDVLSVPMIQASTLGNAKVDELVLPSEVRNLNKRSGSIYYSKAVKNKVLIPTNIWGEVSNSGLHFIPEGTSLVKGLSLAGGPTGDADISKVQVTRKHGNKVDTKTFDLKQGGNEEAHKYDLRPGDVVFVERERYYQDRSYYTSLISVATTILTGILLYRQVDKN